jgi:N-acetylglutamate synthase-like GNAT family acetyltransferase
MTGTDRYPKAATGLVALPLASWERDGLRAALAKAELPAADVEGEGRFFWRFEHSDMPAGFGGLEIHGGDALLRSVVTLAPVRGHGIGAAIFAMLETEATIAGCRTAWTASNAVGFLEKLGYEHVGTAEVPAPIRATPEVDTLLAADAKVMRKPLA